MPFWVWIGPVAMGGGVGTGRSQLNVNAPIYIAQARSRLKVVFPAQYSWLRAWGIGGNGSPLLLRRSGSIIHADVLVSEYLFVRRMQAR